MWCKKLDNLILCKFFLTVITNKNPLPPGSKTNRSYLHEPVRSQEVGRGAGSRIRGRVLFYSCSANGLRRTSVVGQSPTQGSRVNSTWVSRVRSPWFLDSCVRPLRLHDDVVSVGRTGRSETPRYPCPRRQGEGLIVFTWPRPVDHLVGYRWRRLSDVHVRTCVSMYVY